MNDWRSRSKIIFDIDGTLCPIKPAGVSYEELIPDPQMVKKIRELHALGYEIAFSTSRNMRTHQGNIGRINATTAPLIVSWLAKWEIPFDELHLGKPWPGESGFYVDDRAIRPKEFMSLTELEIMDLLKSASIE